MELIEKFIIEVSNLGITDRRDLQKFQRSFSKTNRVAFFTNDKLLEAYHKLVASNTVNKNPNLLKLFTLKDTRSSSGIVVVSVLTKPYPCPGKCIYCPTEADTPKSYLKEEPAVMRALACNYNPYLQVKTRMQALALVGHKTSKVNIRIVGGTWSSYSPQYQTWFVKELFRAANSSSDKGRVTRDESLEKLQEQNETAKHRIVELSIETRQDYINDHEIVRLRKLGVTKVELGVQSVLDDVLAINKRGNTDEDTRRATKLLKDAGFKVSYQMMVNLPGSDLSKDLLVFQKIFSDPSYMPDHLKIYPLALVNDAPVYNLYLQKRYKPYTSDELVVLLSKIKRAIPYFCRVERVIRDIPADRIVEGGAKVSNLRQKVQKEMLSLGISCQCVRCREVKDQYKPGAPISLFRHDYEASGGKEIFLSLESPDRAILYSLLRLRVPSDHNKFHSIRSLRNSVLIREVHTYGPQLDIGEKSMNSAQHQGFGSKLIAEAERISSEEFGISKVAIISGVGVRKYFEKLGYRLNNSYMTKELTS